MRRFLVLLVVVAAGIAAAAVFVPGSAVTVDGTSIARSTLDSQVSAIAGSADYQCYLEARLTVQSNGESNGTLQIYGAGGGAGNGSSASSSSSGGGTYSTPFVDYWLSQMVSNQFLQLVATRHHLAVTPTALALARVDLRTTITDTLDEVADTEYQHCEADGSQVLASLPSSFVDAQVRAEAAGDLIEAHAAGRALTDGSLVAYFAAHRSQFDTLCLSVIQTSSESAATTDRNEVEGGTPFATVATNAGESDGGADGCVAATNPSYASLRSTLGSLKVGQVSQPFENSSSTYVIVQITKETTPSFAGTRPAVLSALLAAGETRATAELDAAIRKAHVSVDPRYGEWQPSAGVAITGPPHPPASAVLSVNADVPGASQSSSSSSSKAG